MEKFKVEFAGETYDVGFINRIEEAHKAVDLLSQLYPKDGKDVLGLDIETAPLPEYEGHGKGGLSPHLSKICTVQIYAPNEKTVFIFHVAQLPYGIACLNKFLESRNFCAHFAHFEIMHLLHNGIVPKSIGCSMMLFQLLIHAITPITKGIKFTLESLVHTAFKIELDKTEQAGKWGDKVLTQAQKEYAAKDAIATQRGALWCLEKMRERDLLSLATFYKINKDAQVAICQMMLNGITIDLTLHNKFIAEWEKEEAAASSELKKTLPPDLNLQSPAQVSAWIRDYLSQTDEGKLELEMWPRSEKTDNLVTDADTLAGYENIPIVAPLSKYKKFKKLNTTYGRNLHNCINPVTGRIHAAFTQCRVDTGRMSSFDPNLQNFPRDPDKRKVFVAPKDRMFVCADLGQIEVRVFAYHAQDEELMEAFENGVDSYILIASKLVRKPMKEVTKDERQKMKAIYLGRMFLLGALTCRKYVKATYGISLGVKETENIIKEIDKCIPGGRRWQLNTTRAAEQSLVTTSRMGKIQKLHPDKYYNKSVNHPVQSDAAACLFRSLTFLDAEIRAGYETGDIIHPVKIVNAVHDEILAECHEQDVEWTKATVKSSMERGVQSVFPEATLRGLVDVKAAKSWGECKE